MPAKNGLAQHDVCQHCHDQQNNRRYRDNPQVSLANQLKLIGKIVNWVTLGIDEAKTSQHGHGAHCRNKRRHIQKRDEQSVYYACNATGQDAQNDGHADGYIVVHNYAGGHNS